MRRIYLESFLGLIILFLASLKGYELIVYELNTDYDYLLQEHSSQAFYDLLSPIYEEKGLEYTKSELEKFATASHRLLQPHTMDELPPEVKEVFDEDPTANIAFDDERDFWFRFDESTPFFKISDNPNSPIIQAVNFDDNMVWIFFIAGFALYCVLLIWFLSRRIRELERVTVEFASGNFKARASTASAKSVGTLNKSFNNMADKVSRLITSNKMLTNAVAHELRTPIFRLQWQADLLADSSLNEQQTKYVNSIVEDIDEMEEMVEELLYYAKMERPETELRTESLELNSLLFDLKDKWQQETPLSITVKDTDCKEAQIKTDPKLLKRALDNLLRNAMRYADSQIMLEVTEDEEHCMISIHDDGNGIDEKDWPHLFEAFYSADKSRNKSTSGFGLGLAIVRQIMELQRGDVSISHSPLGGACFTVSLPK
ncbi:HAMP domain-containing protein [Vibrio parahaemolyticus]|uniref:ATP-binding protein n=1 Tax=Vibrio parahaemolyticus TaxID=670 RepID=UPI00084A913D|nr:ATP-binding protein [Vibrio parahaemolyticus]EGR2183061.1 sensor histidine kinase [Vibrio parahaemolyticus]EGV1829098.1 HAMP domain-containing protein [Vibrio parahaemolyticus]EHH1030601.1 HAMP domain-containing protein [Vibrio parahaemolyticus]EHW0647461.1 HAMP domain-containing protein [Vibrio parahaemolyticus]EII3116052.1 HAMP domain-containing protein [Vibrio parahaemolyticus]